MSGQTGMATVFLVDDDPGVRRSLSRVLREAGVLRSAKVGREVWCWPDPDAVRAALGAVDGYLKAHFRTGGGPRTGAASSPAAGRGARR